MPPVGAERWFHTLVVVGAALGGCGGKAGDAPATGGSSGDGGANTSGANTSGGFSTYGGTYTSGGISPMITLGGAPGVVPREPAGGVPTSPLDCAFDAQYACDDYAAQAGCHCDPSAPTDRSSCQSPFDFVCTEVPLCPPSFELCSSTVFVDCRCDPSRPRPEDCANPEQFYCKDAYPQWVDCSCRADLPVDPASCNDSYCCQSDDPRFGCGCFCVRIK